MENLNNFGFNFSYKKKSYLLKSFNKIKSKQIRLTTFGFSPRQPNFCIHINKKIIDDELICLSCNRVILSFNY